MKKLSSHIGSTLAALPEEQAVAFRKALRTGKVHAMWAQLVEEAILNHTNSIYIIKEDGRSIMHVYVDESIYAAELNNRRELLQLQCNEQFGEAVEEFHIHISRGSMRKRYPYRERQQNQDATRTSVPLSQEEKREVERACAAVEKPSLRTALEKAMIADLEWKKANPQ